MSKSIDITPQQREIILNLLKKYIPDTEVWAYGSRVKWTAKPHSDLDLVAFATEEQSNQISDLRDAFEESDLPFRVDFFVWDEIPDKFHKNIRKNHIVLQKKEVHRKGWREARLGDIATLQRGFDLPKTNRIHGKYPLIASSGEDGTHNTYKAKAPGVVTGRSGTLGEVFFVRKNFWPLNTTLWAKDFHGNNIKFIYYFLKTLNLERYNSGTGVPTLNRNHIHPLSVIVPPLKEQKKIAEILSSLDDKIYLLQRQNKTLEYIAQAIFKSWFIDFDPVHAKKLALEKGLTKKQAKRAAMAVISGVCAPRDFAENFKEIDGRLKQKLSKMSKKEKEGLAYTASLFPSGFEDSELGKVPKGWDISKIEEISENIKENKTPSQLSSDDAYIGLDHMNKKQLFLSRWGNGMQIESNKSSFQKDDILFGKLRPYFHKVCIAPIHGVCSTDILILREKKNIYKTFLLFTINQEVFIQYSNARSTGTRMPRSSWSAVRKYSIVLPDDEMLNIFNDFATKSITAGNLNIKENIILKKTRDSLLPKLLAGEIDLSKINIPESN